MTNQVNSTDDAGTASDVVASVQPLVGTRCATGLLCDCEGNVPCFYCGQPADVPLKLSSSYVDWWVIAQPESNVICRGCEWMLNEKREIVGKDKLQKTRNYSWFVEADKQTPYTKANKSEIAAVLLSPPSPPWAFAIAESGQKHLLFRTPVNVERTPPFAVQLETETIVYTPDELRDRMALARQVVAKVGHKGAAQITAGFAIAAGVELTEQWERVIGEPLTQLALFVTPSQKECKAND